MKTLLKLVVITISTVAGIMALPLVALLFNIALPVVIAGFTILFPIVLIGAAVGYYCGKKGGDKE